MDCPICFLPFDLNKHCPLITECGHTFCSACCIKLNTDSPQCPTCKKKFLPNQFQKLTKNFIVIGYIGQQPIPSQPILNPKCDLHQNPAAFVCEDCCKELCNLCVSLHSHDGHTICDNERFLQDLESRRNDLKLFVETANNKCEFYLTVIRIKNKSMNKEIAAKLDSLNFEQLQKAKEDSLAKVNQAFNNIDTSLIFDLNLGQKTAKLDVRACIREFHDIEAMTNLREKAFKTFKFLKIYNITQFKNWISKDHSGLLKKTLDKIQYKMPYPKPFCFFDLDVNSTLDNEKLQSLLDEYRDYKLPKSHNYLFYSMKPVIDKNSLQLMYLISPKVDDYNANLFIWNSKSINSLQKYDFFYMKSNTSPYYMLSSFCSVKHVYFEILDKVENKEEFQKELINTLKYLSNSLETIEITFDDCHEFVNTLCDNFTSFRKLKALRLNFTSPLPADLSIKLIATLAEYGESLERLNLINIMTGGKIQIIDFLRVINRSKRLVELDMNFVTGDYIEPHLPKVLSEYTNMIDVKLELDWCITQSMVNDFVTLIKNLTSLCALSLEFDFRDELDFNEFFETVIDAPKLQLFGFFLDAKKNNKTLDLDMFERLLKKQLKYLRLALPIDPEGESFINNTLISGAYNYFNSCQEFSLKVYGIDFKPMFENYLSLFIQPSIQMKAWELKIESDPADVESYAYYFVNNLPKSKSKKLVLKFSDSEKVVNTEKLIKNLQVAKKKGKYHSLLFNNKVYLTIEC